MAEGLLHALCLLLELGSPRNHHEKTSESFVQMQFIPFLTYCKDLYIRLLPPICRESESKYCNCFPNSQPSKIHPCHTQKFLGVHSTVKDQINLSNEGKRLHKHLIVIIIESALVSFHFIQNGFPC